MKKCPYCYEDLSDTAIRCKNCRRVLPSYEAQDVIERVAGIKEKQNGKAYRIHRMLNLLVDGMIIEGIYTILFSVLVIVAWCATKSNEKQFDLIEIIQLYKHSFLFQFVIAYAYYFLFESISGKTLGKYFTRTKVIKQDRSQLTSKDVAIRTLCRFFPLEIISYIDGERPVGWHDSWSKTLVVLEDSNKQIRFDLLGFFWKTKNPYVMID